MSVATDRKKEKDKKIREYEIGKALVEYGNEFALSINTYSSYELDLFLTLLYTARKTVKDHMKIPEEKNLKLELSATVLKKGLQGNLSNERIRNGLLKIFNTNIFLKRKDYVEVKHLFETLEYNKDFTKVNFELKKEYIHIFFNLTGNFTQHELIEFTKLKGKYTKKIYQIIMAHKLLKKKEYPADLFKKILDIPVKYNWADITEKIINKAKEEFKETNIKNFILEKIKKGRSVEKIILKWDIREPEIVELDVEAVKEVQFIKENNFISLEQEEEIIKLLEADGMDRGFLLEMKKRNELMYYNTLKQYIK